MTLVKESDDWKSAVKYLENAGIDINDPINEPLIEAQMFQIIREKIQYLRMFGPFDIEEDLR